MKDGSKEITAEQKDSALESKVKSHKYLKYFFDADAVSPEYQGENLHLGESLFLGIETGMKTSEDAREFEKILDSWPSDGIDTDASQGTRRGDAESKIIGFLVGGKIAQKDAAYFPAVINHLVPLPELNKIAIAVYSNWETTDRAKIPTNFSRS